MTVGLISLYCVFRREDGRDCGACPPADTGEATEKV